MRDAMAAVFSSHMLRLLEIRAACRIAPVVTVRFPETVTCWRSNPGQVAKNARAPATAIPTRVKITQKGRTRDAGERFVRRAFA